MLNPNGPMVHSGSDGVHVLVEVRLLLHEHVLHRARRLADLDARDALAGYFAPPLTESERAIAKREGWILGVT
jgi:hypothetical protein